MVTYSPRTWEAEAKGLPQRQGQLGHTVSTRPDRVTKRDLVSQNHTKPNQTEQVKSRRSPAKRGEDKSHFFKSYKNSVGKYLKLTKLFKAKHSESGLGSQYLEEVKLEVSKFNSSLNYEVRCLKNINFKSH